MRTILYNNPLGPVFVFLISLFPASSFLALSFSHSMCEAALIERKAVCELRSRFILDAEYAA